MACKPRTGRPRRRNPLVPALRKMGKRTVPSAKRYKRKDKHGRAGAPTRDDA